MQIEILNCPFNPPQVGDFDQSVLPRIGGQGGRIILELSSAQDVIPTSCEAAWMHSVLAQRNAPQALGPPALASA
jgi:hypothetical protein